jgi:hypothetical protein
MQFKPILEIFWFIKKKKNILLIEITTIIKKFNQIINIKLKKHKLIGPGKMLKAPIKR